MVSQVWQEYSLTNFLLGSLEQFFVFTGSISLLLLGCLIYFKKTYIYTVLQGRWERDVVIQWLGVSIQRYTLLMIALTTLLAVVGWWLYSFYYQFIDPFSFRLPILILVLIISFGAYTFGERWTLLFSLIVIGVFEYLRFFKLVEPAQIWYVREIIFCYIYFGD